MKSAFMITALALTTVMGYAQAPKAGFQVTLSSPQGDLADFVDDQVGFGIGGHLFFDLQGGHALVPRIDYIAYSNDDYDGEAKASTLSFGVDYNYFLERRANRGLYVAAGAAITRGKIEYRDDYDAYYDYSYNDTALGFSIGGGYRFNSNIGVEVKYNTVSFSKYGYDVDAPSLNASFVCRF
ncbi:outer membrane beta-barrel protein [Holophaga foetida]|uniref:outer membrane beta-barrel protein n=1 Tax=Holophaga foetida TaxID=35839 RepID=UPI000247332D|nr:outer membrane beta-barrel protein [Holophaga foetida]